MGMDATTVSRTILVVDDELNNREILRDLLEDEGFKVVLAENGRDGLTKSTQGVGAILMDVIMPQMDGVEAFSAMHRHAPGVPVVVMSGFAGNLNFDRFAEAKPAALLAKPFTRETLQARLESILGRN